MSSAPAIDAFLAELDGEPDLAARVAPLVRRYLGLVREYLARLHRESGSGRVVNEANSDGMDRLIRRLFVLAEECWIGEGHAAETGLCVVAVGGYARREMSIHSDVDLLVLYREELTPYVARIAERLQYWLWDAGLTVGCATRTIDETVKLGRQDVTVRTGVLTARFLCGDGEFFHDFADTIRGELLPDVGAFIAEQLQALRERHAEYGESLFLLQPNLKEGAGGLRDYHAAYWVARGAQPSVRDLDDFLHFGLLTEGEMVDYRAALDFLWRVRNELHLEARRCSDQMSFELQERIAETLGYGSADESSAELPVERFMRDYYRHARVIQNSSELVIEQCAARASGASRRRSVRRGRPRLPDRERAARDPARGAPAGGSGPAPAGLPRRPGARRPPLAHGAPPGARESGSRGRSRPQRSRGGRDLHGHPRRRAAGDAHPDGDERGGAAGGLPARVGAHRLPLAARDLPHVHGRRALDLPGRGAAPTLARQVRGRRCPS